MRRNGLFEERVIGRIVRSSWEVMILVIPLQDFGGRSIKYIVEDPFRQSRRSTKLQTYQVIIIFTFVKPNLSDIVLELIPEAS